MSLKTVLVSAIGGCGHRPLNVYNRLIPCLRLTINFIVSGQSLLLVPLN